MNPRELQQQFRSAPWRRKTEVDVFVAAAAELPREELPKFLELLKATARNTGTARLQASVVAALFERMGDRNHFLPLLRAAKTLDAAAQQALVPALVRLNNPHHHPELVGLLRSPEAPLRQLAIAVLSEVAGRTAFELIEEAVGDASFPARVEALRVLVRVGGARALGAIERALPVASSQEKLDALELTAELAAKDPAGVKCLALPLLQDASPELAARALKTLARCGDLDAVLLHAEAAAASPHEPLWTAAFEVLALLRDRRVVALLSRLLATAEEPRARRCIEGLAAQAPDHAVAALVTATSSSVASVRADALSALQRLVPALSASGRVVLVTLLLRRGEAALEPVLAAAMPSGTPASATLCTELLGVLRGEDLWTRSRAAALIARVAGRHVSRSLLALLSDSDAGLRRFAIEALEAVREPFALPLLCTMSFADSDWWVRERAVEALGNMGDRRAGPHLLKLLANGGELVAAALGALANLEHSEALPQVLPFLKHPSAEIRRAALAFVAKLGSAAIASSVQPLSNDDDEAVAKEARALLQKWKPELTLPGPSEQKPLEALLSLMVERGGDDLILAGGRKPAMKRLGTLQNLREQPLSAVQLNALLQPLLNEAERARLAEGRDVDLTCVPGGGLPRFRVNVFRQQSGLSAVFRIIKDARPALESLGLPAAMESVCGLRDGLVLVGGATGSGKSTTLASLIDRINRTASRHIVSLEDPIEVVHPCLKSLVSQRHVGVHTKSFASGVAAAMRENADVILVGEMRDAETIAAALSAAETGHLVLGTVHTVSADASIDRIVNAFPAGEHEAVRALLASTLRAVMCQTLIARADGTGRALAAEVLLNTPAVGNLIRKGQAFQLASVMATSREAGMQLLDNDLMRLVQSGAITAEAAYLRARNKADFEPLLPRTEAPAPEAAQPQTPHASRAA